MENLWPNSLFKGVGDPNIEQLLVSQAEAIWATSKGLVTGVVRNRSVSPGHAWSFGVHPTRQSSKATDLLIVRSQNGAYPAVVQVFYDGNQFQKVTDLAEMKSSLKRIFSSDETKKIVGLLGAEAVAAGVSPDIDQDRLKRPEPRPLLIGKIAKTARGDFAHVALAGVAGFLSGDDIRRLQMEPDEQGSPIQSLDDRYVITLNFVDSCKFSVSREELQVLKAEARKSVG